MKTKLALTIFLGIIFANLVFILLEHGSVVIMDGIQAGNFINTKDLDLGKATMLHWFAKEVEIYSEDNEKIYFVIFDSYKNLTLYKNKSLIMQSESTNFPKFQRNNTMVFGIDNNDYIDHRVNIYSEVAMSNDKIHKYDNNHFVGSYSSILNLIIIKNIITILSRLLFLFCIVIYILNYKKDLYKIILALASLSILVRVDIGVLFCVLFLYFHVDKIFRKGKRDCIISFSIIGILLLSLVGMIGFEFNILQYNISILHIILIVAIVFSGLNYIKRSSHERLTVVIGFVTISTFICFDHEFSFCRLFYEEILIIICFIIISSLSIIKMRHMFANSKTVEVNMLRGISHDLRIPLSTIKLNVELLGKDDFTTEINKGLMLNIIKDAIEDISNMTSTLTAYVSSDRYTNTNEKANVNDAIEKTASYFINNEKNIDIKLDICNEDLYLKIDKIWLNRLIYNLIDNGYKYTNDFGEITIGLRKDKKLIEIYVEDNGIGMCNHELQNILKPFYRIDKSRNIVGLGLGLSIVKDIVEKLEGTIEIRSKLDEGTKIIIKI